MSWLPRDQPGEDLDHLARVDELRMELARGCKHWRITSFAKPKFGMVVVHHGMPAQWMMIRRQRCRLRLLQRTVAALPSRGLMESLVSLCPHAASDCTNGHDAILTLRLPEAR